MSGNPPRFDPGRLPSPDKVRAFIVLVRRYADAAARGLEHSSASIDGLFDPEAVPPCGDDPLDDVYQEMNILLKRVEATLAELDFISPYRWSERFRSRLSALRHGLFRYGNVFPRHDFDLRDWRTWYWGDGSYDRLVQMVRLIKKLEEAVDSDDVRLGDRPEPAVPFAIPVGSTAGAGPVVDFSSVVSSLRKARKATPAALVEYMADKSEASSEDVARHVHGNPKASTQAIRQNVARTNQTLEEMGCPMRMRLASSRVFREICPE